ncbi:hypothetical protein [Streptomyces sp. NPDC006640]|uniref:hypothetical protein n=1 Tax=unclassified Streptomyces TaxID=2593676 RepID=UPI00369F97C0
MAQNTVSRNRRELGTLPLWVFSSGPLDSTASVRNIRPEDRVLRKGRDFRDVEQIEAWAAGIGRTLTAREPPR